MHMTWYEYVQMRDRFLLIALYFIVEQEINTYIFLHLLERKNFTSILRILREIRNMQSTVTSA